MKKDKLDLYYYTTTETMRYILENGDIYATHMSYMNDSEEYKNGLRELKNLVNQRLKNQSNEDAVKGIEKIQSEEIQFEEMPDSFSISFSTNKDLLSQWSMYAKESGVSLHMQFQRDEIYEAPDSEKNIKSKIGILSPEKVFYYTEHAMRDESIKNKIANQIWEKISDELEQDNTKADEELAVQIWRIIKKNAPYIKRYEFNAEDEYRLVFAREDWSFQHRIDYRMDKNVLKPYLDVTCQGGWPIKEIIVGPGFNQDIVYKSICHFMENVNLQVKICDGQQFFEACIEFLKRTGMDVEELTNEKDNIKKLNDMEVRFVQWKAVLKRTVNDLKKVYENCYLSKQGIIVCKSDIPYLF